MPSAPTISTNVPKRDGQLRNWMENFARHVSSDPDRYHLPADVVAMLNEFAARYSKAYALATQPSTKTKPQVAEKNKVRDEAVATFRAYAMQIRNDPRISNADKVALGFRIAR